MNTNLYLDPLLAKALATRSDVIFCIDLGLKQAILEGDTFQVVERIQKQQVNDTCFGMFIVEIVEFCFLFSLLLLYYQWSMNHIGRDCYKAAHALSNDALGVTDVMIDLEDFPQCI